MSLDHSPSPHQSGGWSSPGLTTPYEETNGSRSRGPSPSKRYGDLNGGQDSGVTWANAKANSARVNGYPTYQSQNQGFFARHMRRMSQNLPYFQHGGQEDRYAEKEKLGRGRAGGGGGIPPLQELPRRVGLMLSRRRKWAALLIVSLLAIFAWFHKRA